MPRASLRVLPVFRKRSKSQPGLAMEGMEDFRHRFHLMGPADIPSRSYEQTNKRRPICIQGGRQAIS